MANRVIRDWTDSEQVDSLSLKAEVFFTRLIMKTDDYGNYTANVRLINAALFPLKGYEVSEVSKWLDECIVARIVCKYSVDGKEYIHIRGFDQKLRRMKHTYPPPHVGQVTDTVRTGDGQKTAETKRNEVETEDETKRKTLDGFKKVFEDEIWREQMQMIHKFKNLDQAIAEVYGKLLAEPARMASSSPNDLKNLVNTWLSNMRSGKINEGVKKVNLV